MLHMQRVCITGKETISLGNPNYIRKLLANLSIFVPDGDTIFIILDSKQISTLAWREPLMLSLKLSPIQTSLERLLQNEYFLKQRAPSPDGFTGKLYHLRKVFYQFSITSFRGQKWREHFLTHSVRPALP